MVFTTQFIFETLLRFQNRVTISFTKKLTDQRIRRQFNSLLMFPVTKAIAKKVKRNVRFSSPIVSNAKDNISMSSIEMTEESIRISPVYEIKSKAIEQGLDEIHTQRIVCWEPSGEEIRDLESPVKHLTMV